MAGSALKTKKRPTVFFLHIPKAAGKTLLTILSRQYGPEQIYNIYGYRVGISEAIDTLKKLPDEEKLRIKLFQGHYEFGLHRFLPQECTYITMLRDPVDRLISHYFYLLSTPIHPFYTTVTSYKMSLREYVSSGIAPELNNGQVRLISGVSVRGGSVSSDDLKLAKRNLNDYFATFGLVERFDESLILFKKLLGWRNIYYVKQNVTHGRPSKCEISSETVKTIEKYNSLDMELYEVAGKIFDEKLRGEKSLKRQLLALRFVNRTYGIAYRLMKTQPARGAQGLASRFLLRM